MKMPPESVRKMRSFDEAEALEGLRKALGLPLYNNSDKSGDHNEPI